MSFLMIYVNGLIGFTLKKTSVIKMLMFIELLILGVTMLFVEISNNYSIIDGQALAVRFISIAAAESVIGLSLIIAVYRGKGVLCIY